MSDTGLPAQPVDATQALNLCAGVAATSLLLALSQHCTGYRPRPYLIGGLNRSPQHFVLEGKDGVWDGTEIS